MVPPSDPLDAPLWPGLRRLILFVLGVAVICEALAAAGQNIAQLLVGALLVGMVSVDDVAERMANRRRRHLPPTGDAVSSEGGETD